MAAVIVIDCSESAASQGFCFRHVGSDEKIVIEQGRPHHSPAKHGNSSDAARLTLPSPRGAETGCYDIAHYLPENGCKSFIVTSGGDLTKFINKEKVKLIKLPVHSKNPLLILLNTLALIFIIIFNNITIVHARSRAPAWSCLFATKITRRKFVTTFHGTYNFNNKLKRFYNSVMVKSNLVIAGSNFIFSHIKNNYSDYLDIKNKLLVIFRGINVDYFDHTTKTELEEKKLLKNWGIEENKKIILLPGRLTSWKGQELFLEAINMVNIQLGYEAFYAVILGSEQGRDLYKKNLLD